ncbi:MAG: methionyl-tRNA formyltransferase [Eubacteriaceae bacterium]|nr:methionyl-tRNA formyltransferase [Eubacteriaceae bacterium]
MKIVFMGTPDFAVPTLEKLCEAGHEVGFAVTQPDTARDRGKKIKYTPVKEKALQLGIEVLQPEKIKNNAGFMDKIKEYSPDVTVVVAYGKLLPKELLDIPAKGCINVHASLLPRHRGAAPIQRAIIDGDEKTGVTIMYMAEGLDTGDMLAAAETPVDRKNAGQLHDELSVMGAELLTKTLEKVEAGTVHAEKQDDSRHTYAPMIFKKDGLIDFGRNAVDIERQIRGLDPWPGAYTFYKGGMFKIWKADTASENSGTPAGTITDVSDEGISISCGEGTLIAKTIQLPGKKRVPTGEFLKGNNIDKSEVLG